jgi:hypothetical protein
MIKKFLNWFFKKYFPHPPIKIKVIIGEGKKEETRLFTVNSIGPYETIKITMGPKFSVENEKLFEYQLRKIND